MANGRQLLRSRALTVGVLLYLLALAVLWRRPEFSLADTLLELFIFGLGLSLIAWWATIRAKPLAVAAHPGAGEMLGLLAYLVALSVYLAFGPQWIDSWLPQAWIESERAHFFVNLAKKLVVFVLLPFAVFGPLCGYALRDFGWQTAGLRELFRSHLPVVLLLSGVILALQYFLGGGAAPIREGKLTSQQLLVGLPLCFLWLAIEAGSCGGILFSRSAPDAFQRVVQVGGDRDRPYGAGLRSRACARFHFSSCGNSGRPGRKSLRPRRGRLLHRDAIGERDLFWDRVGSNEESFCGHRDPRRDRPIA